MNLQAGLDLINNFKSGGVPTATPVASIANKNLQTGLDLINNYKPPIASTAPVAPVKSWNEMSFGEKTQAVLKETPYTIQQMAEGFKGMFTNPSETEQAVEKQIIPEPLRKSIISAPIKAGIRFFEPMVEPLGKDIGQILATNELSKKVAKSEMPASVLNDIEVLKKTAPQIVGDVAQVVLAIYTPKVGLKAIKQGIKLPAMEAIKRGVATGTAVGLPFGAAQALSSGSKDPYEIAQIIGQTAGVGGILGGITAGVIPVSKGIFEKVANIKKVADTMKPPEPPPPGTPAKDNVIYGQPPPKEPPVSEYMAKVKAEIEAMAIKPEVPKPFTILSDFPTKKGSAILGYFETKEIANQALKELQPQFKNAYITGREIKPAIPPELQPFAQEARKYKSAEEFVKTQQPVYHGSPVPLKSFSNKKGGVFFTDKYADATGFAGSPDNVYEGYLNLKNPLVIDAKGAKWDELNTKYGKSTQEVIGNAQKDGFDGVVFKNIVDNIGDTAEWGGQSTISYVYKPKDAFLNKSQLTDFYNKAIKGVKEVKPEIPPNLPDKLQSRVFQRLKEERQQEMGFTPEGMSRDVLYNEIKLKKDAENAAELIKTDKQKAYRVAMGAEELPNLTSTTVNIAMSEKALTEGNNALYSKLVRNRSIDQTRRGQEIVAEKGSVSNNSVSKYVKELISTRLEKLGKSYLEDLKGVLKKKTNKKKAIAAIDREMAKAKEKLSGKKLDIKEAQSLIDRLACK